MTEKTEFSSINSTNLYYLESPTDIEEFQRDTKQNTHQLVAHSDHLLKTWNSSSGMVSLYIDAKRQWSVHFRKNSGENLILKQTANLFDLIISAPRDVNKKSSSALMQFFSDTHLRIAEVQDKYKFYVEQRLPGGVITLEEAVRLTEVDLSIRIQKALPANTYSSVEVRTIAYNFSGIREDSPATRRITLNLRNSQEWAIFFYAFFSGIGLCKSTDVFEQNIDENTLKAQLLETILGEEGEQQQIEYAYQQARVITLYLSVDCQSIELLLGPSSAQTIFRIGKTIRIIGNAIQAISRLLKKS